jgi:hypothetical protein
MKTIQSKDLTCYEIKNEITDNNDSKGEDRTEFLIRKKDYIDKLRKKEEDNREKLRQELIDKQIKYERARQDARDVVIKKNKDFADIEKKRIDDILKAQTIMKKGINKEVCNELDRNFYDNKHLHLVTDNFVKEKYKEEKNSDIEEKDEKRE